MRSTDVPTLIPEEDQQDGITAEAFIRSEFESFLDRMEADFSMPHGLVYAVANDYLNNTNAHVEAWDQEQEEAQAVPV